MRFGAVSQSRHSASFRLFPARVLHPAMAARSQQMHNFVFSYPLPAIRTHRSLLQEAQQQPPTQGTATRPTMSQDEVVAHLASLSVATPKILSSPTAPLSPVGTSLLATRRLNQKRRTVSDSLASTTSSVPPRSGPAADPIPVSLMMRRDKSPSRPMIVQPQTVILTASSPAHSRTAWVFDV